MVLAWLAIAACLVSAVTMLMAPSTGTSGAVLLVGVAWVLYLALVRPKVVCRDEDVVVVNLVREHTIPYGRIRDVDTRHSLRIHIDDGSRVTAFGAPAPSVLGAERLSRDSRRHDVSRSLQGADTVRPGDVSDSSSGAPATVIRRRLESPEPLELGPVRSRWDVTAITVTALLTAVWVLASVLDRLH